MKLNSPNPFAKYLVIASCAVIVFSLVFTYVKFTNNRVYELAIEQVEENEVRSESIKETSSASAINGHPEAMSLSDGRAYRTDAKEVENHPSGEILIAGKSARTCMRELHTKVINNDVVKCTHDHYVKNN